MKQLQYKFINEKKNHFYEYTIFKDTNTVLVRYGKLITVEKDNSDEVIKTMEVKYIKNALEINFKNHRSSGYRLENEQALPADEAQIFQDELVAASDRYKKSKG